MDPLIRKQLPKDWVDLVVGEAYVVRQALIDTFPKNLFATTLLDACEYQPPEGYPPLVNLLEEHYGTSAIVTSGAKQGLSAVFHHVKKSGLEGVTIRSPYWSQMPAAIELSGLKVSFSDHPVPGSAYLLVSPNNPDGFVCDYGHAHYLYERCRTLGVPLIHDAAYHNPIYIDRIQELADISIFSLSKAYGLSGLRIGYVVTHDPKVRQSMCEYIEATTVGVSLLSQHVVYNILKYRADRPKMYEKFVQNSRSSLMEAKGVMSKLRPDILDTTQAEHTPGMFGWFRVGKGFFPEEAKVAVAPGKVFGDETRVRVNLAVGPKVLREAVRRLHSARRSKK